MLLPEKGYGPTECPVVIKVKDFSRRVVHLKEERVKTLVKENLGAGIVGVVSHW